MRMLAGPNNQNRTTPAPERFTIVNGQPQTIALQYPTGKRVTSRIPGASDQMMYTLADGRRAYFPLEIGAEIDALRLAPGQPFTICKYGPRDWDVQYAQAPAPQPPPQAWHDLDQPPPPPPQRVNGAGEDAGTILERCYARAIEIQAAALDQARAKGLHLMPTAEALQACAATLFIAETRRLDR